MGKAFKDLNLSHAFLFATALEDPETCQIVLEIILGRKVPKVQVSAEHSVLVSSDVRSIRLDIYASDEVQVHYNLEAQNQDRKNLAKRSRYHLAEMDVSSLKPGDDYNNLKPGYVIFICTFDPFGKDLYRYTFEERCSECDIGLGDETCRIFLNTKGKNDKDVPSGLVHFLKYMEQSTDEYVEAVDDDSITRLHNKIRQLKQWRELEARYMTVEELIKDRETDVKIESVLELLEEYGTVPGELREKISAERDMGLLRAWHKLAARVNSIEEFLAEM